MSRKTKPETCEECGVVFMTHSFQKRGKKGWICSAACVKSRRLRIHGQDCRNCGSRYVKESTKTCNTGFCCRECKTESAKRSRMAVCGHCKEEFENINNTTFCSSKCFAEQKRTEASKNCLCCGKTWYRHSISKKKSKYATSKYHNCFCSKACAKKYQEYECGRKARCRCGKPTGESRVNVCTTCKSASEWAELGPFSDCIGTVFLDSPNDWEKRCHNAASSLRIRNATTTGREKNKTKGLTWTQVEQREWTALIERCRQRNAAPWQKRIQNAVNLLGKRQRRKQLRPN